MATRRARAVAASASASRTSGDSASRLRSSGASLVRHYRPMSHPALALLGLLAVSGGGAVPASFDLLLRANPSEVTPGEYVVSVDGRETCRIAVTSKGGQPVSCRATLPAAARALAVGAGRRRRSYALVSVAGVTEPFRQGPPAVAVGGLTVAVEAVLSRLGSGDRAIELGLWLEPKVPAGAFEAAEKRLGFPLDPALKAVLTNAGVLGFDDSFLVRPDQFATTERQFTTLWGQPERVKPEALAVYRQSTMVWIEAGDGYGALVYQPKGPQRCGGSPAYWRIHQEWIDAPVLVTNADGSCGGLGQALLQGVIADVVGQIEDRRSEEQLLVDPTASALEVWLSTDANGVPALRSNWATMR